jgi:hypothetical protein
MTQFASIYINNLNITTSSILVISPAIQSKPLNSVNIVPNISKVSGYLPRGQDPTLFKNTFGKIKYIALGTYSSLEPKMRW